MDVIQTMCTIRDPTIESMRYNYTLFINGGLIGILWFDTHDSIKDVHFFIQYLKVSRFDNADGGISNHTGIPVCYVTKSVRIRTSAGRLVHPYIVVRDLRTGLHPTPPGFSALLRFLNLLMQLVILTGSSTAPSDLWIGRGSS